MSEELTKKEDTESTSLMISDNVTFNMPTVTKGVINPLAVAKVNEGLPELNRQTRNFDRNNSQTTLSMMSITMLNGHSPYRMMRQVMAEAEKRKLALAEAQVGHAKKRKEIEKLQEKVDENPDDEVLQARLRLAYVSISTMESKMNGSFKDIATLIDTYESIKKNNGITEWDEESFENEEKRHHVRRGFELMYRNLMDGGRISTSTIEYMQQFGVHPQVAMTETQGYIASVTAKIKNLQLPHSNDLEEFLDKMADKYYKNADLTTERIFGKSEVYNTDYMNRLNKPEETEEE